MKGNYVFDVADTTSCDVLGRHCLGDHNQVLFAIKYIIP